MVFLKKTQIRLFFNFIMTQQIIHIIKSSDKIRDSFVSHFKNTFSLIYLNENKFELENLHGLLIDEKKLLKKGTDQSTLFHKAIYSTFDEPNYFSSQFWHSYKELCLEIVDKLKIETCYQGEWAIQRFPTIRFHFPNNVSVFEFHRDSNYSHPIGEINCFYALNECINSSALQVEKNLGFEDYVPLNLQPGEYGILNTSIYKHGDLINKTGKTRVSMDFRFIPTIFLSNSKISLTKQIKFTTNSYFIKEKEMINL